MTFSDFLISKMERFSLFLQFEFLIKFYKNLRFREATSWQHTELPLKNSNFWRQKLQCVTHRLLSLTYEVKKKQKYKGLRSANKQNNSVRLKGVGFEQMNSSPRVRSNKRLRYSLTPAFPYT